MTPPSSKGWRRAMAAANRLTPKVVVDDFVGLPGEQPHLDLAGAVEIAAGQPTLVGGHHIHDVAVGNIGGDVVDGPAKDPGMALDDGFVAPSFEDDSVRRRR